MTHYVGLDVSQKLTAICVVDNTGRRLWRGQCTSDPEQIDRAVRRHGGTEARIGIETGPMTPWLVHELRGRGLDVTCLDARHARAALTMQINKTDQNDAEGLAQIMRPGWYRSVHVKSFDSHRARALLGARAQLVGMTTRLRTISAVGSRPSGCCRVRCVACRSTGGSRACSPIVTMWPRSSGPCSRPGGSCVSRSPPSTKRYACW